MTTSKMEPNTNTPVYERRSYRILHFVSFVYSFALAARILYANKLFYHDDAYITLRYARNFLSGHGIVWNAGEYVQGYTNFLHLVLISGIGLAGVDLVRASRILGVSAVVGLVSVLLLFLGRASRRSTQKRNISHLPVMLTISSAPMIVWSIGGLEGTLFAFLSSTGCLWFLAAMDNHANWRIHAASGICLALAYLTHPTGLVFIAVSICWLLITVKSRPARSAAAFIAPCLAILAAYTFWQFFYYGDVVPNTFYTKAGNFTMRRLLTGLRYLAAYSLQPPYMPIFIAVTLAYAIVSKKWHWPAHLSYLALFIAGYSALIVFIGGDHMKAFRLCLPLVVPLTLMLYFLLSSLVNTANRAVVIALTAIVLLLAGLQLIQERLNPRTEDPASFTGTIVGKYVSKAWPEGSLIALNTAGSTPYYAPRHRFIDMLGLNDRHIAKRLVTKTELPWQMTSGHLKGDGTYVLSRAPDFIIVGPAQGTDISKPWFLSDLEMGRDPRFAQTYTKKQVGLNRRGEITEQGRKWFTYYQRSIN